MKTTDSLRVVLGFLIAPFSACLVGEVFTTWMSDLSFLAALFAYPFGLIPGIPMYLLFQRLGWLKFWQTAVAATVAGALEGAAFYWVGVHSVEGTLTVRDWLYTEGMFSLAAFIVGTTFWFLAIGRFGRK